MANYLVKHGRGWKFKKAVPADVQDALAGRKHWIETLGQCGYQDALARARERGVKCDKLIRKVRRLSPAERTVFAAAGGSLQGLTAATDDTGAIFIEAAALHTAPNPDDPEAMQAEEALVLHRDRQEAAAFRDRAARARALLTKMSPDHGGLHDLIPTWHRVKAITAKRSPVQMQLYLNRFIEVIGNRQPLSVTAQHVIAFRDAMETWPKVSPTTARKHLDGLHALFAVAVSEGLCAGNPVHGITVRKVVTKHAENGGKKEFSAAHVKHIFDEVHVKSDDFQWVVRLLAYHGSRSGEICQIQPGDIYVERGGITVMRLTDQQPGKTIKNANSVRLVPLHPACAGFVDYAKAAHDRGAEWVFSSFPVWKERAGYFQSHGSIFLRKHLGITDRALTMHSFRHTWRTLAREIDMPDAVACAIGGWSLGKGEQAKYGGHVSLAKRAEWLGRIDPLAR